MDAALETREGRGRVRQALTMLRQSGAEHDGDSLRELALQLLPIGFATSARMCNNPDCRFSLRRIGQPGRADKKAYALGVMLKYWHTAREQQRGVG